MGRANFNRLLTGESPRGKCKKRGGYEMRWQNLKTILAAGLILMPAAFVAAEDYVEGEVLVKCITTIAILDPGPPPITNNDELNAVIVELGVYEIPEIFDFLPTEPIGDPNGKWDWEDWLSVMDIYHFETYYLFKYNGNVSPQEAANLLGACGIVDYAEPEYFGVADTGIPNDPIFEDQWYLHKIKGPEAWDYWPPPFRQPLVAVVDHDIVNHTDLEGNLVPGYPSDEYKRLKEQTDQHYPYHGTMVSGVIAAVTNNGYGMAGIGFNYIKVMPVNVTTDPDPKIAKGILWAALKGADVENFSWVLGPFSNFDIIHKAIQAAYDLGVIMCAGKGNDGVYNDPEENPNWPSDWKEVIAVTGTNEKDELWYEHQGLGSNFGPDTECAGPAHNIITTWYGSYFITESGTSFSAPHASAVCGLIQAHWLCVIDPPVDRVALARGILKHCCDDNPPPGWDEYFGWGRVNLKKTIEYLINDSSRDVKVINDKNVYLTTTPRIFGNYPNPARGTTSFKFDLPASGGSVFVKLEVYDLSGRRVATVIEETLPPGSYERRWDCTDKSAQKLPAGVYIYSVRVGAGTSVRKLVIINE